MDTLFGQRGAAVTCVVEASETRLGVEMRGLGFPALRGRFDRFWVAIPAGGGLDLRVEAASLSTGNAARDARLTGPARLDAARYPEIVFRSRGVEPIPVLEGELTRVTGDLTIRDTTRPARWEFELLARAQDAAGTLGAGYTGRLELSPRTWGLGSASITVTVVLQLMVLAGAGPGRTLRPSLPGEEALSPLGAPPYHLTTRS